MTASDRDARIEQREAVVFGAGPRVEPLAREEFSEAAREIHERMVDAAAQATGRTPVDHVPEMVATMLRRPALFERISGLSMELLGGGRLSARDRELLILRLAWLCQAPFEWGEHVRLAKLVGIDSVEIERVQTGSSAEGWSEGDRALMRAVEELHDGAMISDETWAALAAHLDEEQLMEVPVLVGHYQTVAYFQNALRLRLEPDNPGLGAL